MRSVSMGGVLTIVPTSGTQVPLHARQAPRQYESNRGRISRLAACRHRRYTGLRGCPTLDASVAIDYMKHVGSVTGIDVALGQEAALH